MSHIRLLVVEDCAVLRAGLCALLRSEEDMEVVGEAADGREAVGLTRALQPDVVLMDRCLPIMNGLEATRQIKADSPGTGVLIFSLLDNEEYALAALEAGAAGFVPKGVTPKELGEAIRAVSRREPFLYPSCAKEFIEAYLKERAPAAM